MMRIVPLAWLFALGVHAADAPFAFKDGAQEERFRRLASELRCLVCQNQSLEDSNAPLAQDLRKEVHEQMQKGASDREIIGFVTARYGDFVLYRPPVKTTTFLLWAGPGLLLLAGGAFAWRVVKRQQPVNRSSEADSDTARRAAELLASARAPARGKRS
ncbi:MAG: cytochrome c-type biogenesis protein [Burkholderiales bacterium]